MFQSLRPNNQIFILKKDIPSLEVGSVVSVSNPIPKYPTNFGQPQEMILDLVVKVNGQDIPFQKIPATLDIADFGTSGVVIADNRDAMNSEIASLKQKSRDILQSIDYHKRVVDSCDKMLSDINPEFAEKQAQQAEINALKLQVSDLSKNITELLNQFKTKENYENVGNTRQE